MVALSTDALETGPVFAVVERGVDKYLWLRAVCVSTGNYQISFVEMSVTE